MSLKPDSEISVLVIDPAESARIVMLGAVRSFGFKAVSSPTIVDAKRDIHAGNYDWIITSLYANERYTAIHLLDDLAKSAEKSKTRVSLFVDSAEKRCLPLAFERGLFSWHKKPFNRQSFNEEMETLQLLHDQCGENDAVAAAVYLRRYLYETDRFGAIVALERALCRKFPSQTKLLFNLAKAHFKSGKTQDGLSVLGEIKSRDESLVPEVDVFFAKYVDGIGDDDDPSKSNALGINNCVIVDPDSSIQKSVQDILQRIGVRDILTFNDGKAAWDWIRTASEPELIIQEWKIPQLSGPQLVQRIRSHGFSTVPIIVVSALVRKDDLPLLQEMSISNTIMKPFNAKEFVLALAWSLRQADKPSDQKAMERKMLLLLEQGKREEAEKLKGFYMESDNPTEGRKKYMEAEFAYSAGNFEAAKNYAMQAIKMSDETAYRAINILGKAFFKLGDLPNAMQCYEKAQSLSPKNIQRICDMAVVTLETGDSSAAREKLAEAKNMDENNSWVKGTGATIALAEGNVEEAKSLLKDIKMKSNIVAYMNNRAVLLIHAEKYDEGIALYQKILDALPGEEEKLASVVNYNLSLAYARCEKLNDALGAARRAVEFRGTEHYIKARSLVRRLEESIKENKPLTLAQDAVADAELIAELSASDDEGSEEKMAMDLAGMENETQARYCLKDIFTCPDKHDGFSMNLVS